MPRVISPQVFQALHRLDSGVALLWLYEVEVPSSPPTRIRMVGNSPSLETFRGNSYYPFPVTHTPVEEDTEGNLSVGSLVVGNITREINTVLTTYNGLIGSSVRIMLVSKADMLSGQPIIEQDFKIRRIAINAEAITAQLANYNLFNTNFPAQRMMRGHCRFGYRSVGCGYSVPISEGGLATCDKTYDGANGCTAHGESEVSAGYEQLHPKRIGAFLGIPRPSGGGGL
jgi:phage-related protein